MSLPISLDSTCDFRELLKLFRERQKKLEGGRKQEFSYSDKSRIVFSFFIFYFDFNYFFEFPPYVPKMITEDEQSNLSRVPSKYVTIGTRFGRRPWLQNVTATDGKSTENYDIPTGFPTIIENIEIYTYV